MFQPQQQSSQAAGVALHRMHPHRHPLRALCPHSKAVQTELLAGPSKMAGEQYTRTEPSDKRPAWTNHLSKCSAFHQELERIKQHERM